MDETRVSRYQEYRQSFIKEGAIPLETSEEETGIDISATTSTLPIDEVIEAAHEEENRIAEANKARRNHIIKIVVEITVAVLVVAGLVVLGIFAWRTK